MKAGTRAFLSIPATCNRNWAKRKNPCRTLALDRGFPFFQKSGTAYLAASFFLPAVVTVAATLAAVCLTAFATESERSRVKSTTRAEAKN